MNWFFNEIIYRPIFNLLVLIYNLIPGQDFGLAIVALTILIRLIFIPLSIKTLRSQKEMTKLQPRIRELQEKYKGDKQTLGRETMALYREHKVNPLGGCLPLLIQLPFLFAIYRAFSVGLDPKSLSALYPFVQNPGTIRDVSLGFINLSQRNPILAIGAGLFQFIQSKLSVGVSSPQAKSGPKDTTQIMNRQMLYFFPIMVIIISWSLPTGLVIYWLVTTLFSIGEQLFINKKFR